MSGGSRIRVAHVCPFVGEQFGGSERFVANISKRQVQHHDVTIFTSTKHRARSGNTHVSGVTINRTFAPATIWNIDPLCLLARKIVKSDADIVHIHSYLYTMSAQAVFANLIRKKKTLLQIHGGIGPPPYRTSLTRRITKSMFDKSIGSFIFSNSDVIASVSHRDLEYVASHYGISDENVYYVPNCVDTKRFGFTERKHQNETPTLLYVGDLELWKGLDLIYNWLLNEERTNKRCFTFRFVGQGSMFDTLHRLKEHIERNGSKVRIELLGQKQHQEIHAIMADANALVLPSVWEATPTVVLEAMATGLPVVATKVGDIPLMLRNGENGFLINRTAESLDQVYDLIVSRLDLVNEKVKSARQAVERDYSLEAVVPKLDRLYNAVVPSYQ